MTRKSRGLIKGQPMRFILEHRNWKPISYRFWKKVNKDGPLPDAGACEVFPEITGTQCWLWAGANKGEEYPYGTLGVDGKNRKATHVAWFLETGEWPTDQALHKCDNPACVRFLHLFQGTHADNMTDIIAKNIVRGKGNCPPARRNLGRIYAYAE